MANPAQVKTKTDMGLRERIKTTHQEFKDRWDAMLDTLPDCSGAIEHAKDEAEGIFYDQILRVCIEELSERFNSYLNERIADWESMPPLTENHKRLLSERLATFRWVKQNFERIVKEIEGEH